MLIHQATVESPDDALFSSGGLPPPDEFFIEATGSSLFLISDNYGWQIPLRVSVHAWSMSDTSLLNDDFYEE